MNDLEKAQSCIDRVTQREPYLTGAGVIVAVLDSGIDYFLPEFLDADGQTRIIAIWDQSGQPDEAQGKLPPAGYREGVLYTREMINEALALGREEGQKRVPVVDFSGHGTAVTGVAAGTGMGVAPDAELLIIKLGNPPKDTFPRTTQLMRGVNYAVNVGIERNQPVAVNISFGNNYGAHNGTSLLESYLDTVAGVGKNVICVGMGNEGVSGVHQSLVLPPDQTVISEFSIGEFERSTNLQLWKSYTDRVRIHIENPSGLIVGPFEELLGTQRFRFPDTELLVYYGTPTPYGVYQEIYMDFLPQGQYLQSGVWKIRIKPVRIEWNLADLWLPVSEASSARTRFLTPSPAGSFTVPAPARNVISVAAYDSRTNAYAEFSGRAFQVLPWEGKPDLAAPGVDIQTTAAGGGYRTVSGTSFATPFVTGSAALLMEWGIVRGNDPFLFGNKVKAYLRGGARRLPGFPETPNYRVGYGRVCISESIPK